MEDEMLQKVSLRRKIKVTTTSAAKQSWFTQNEMTPSSTGFYCGKNTFTRFACIESFLHQDLVRFIDTNTLAFFNFPEKPC